MFERSNRAEQTAIHLRDTLGSSTPWDEGLQKCYKLLIRWTRRLVPLQSLRCLCWPPQGHTRAHGSGAHVSLTWADSRSSAYDSAAATDPPSDFPMPSRRRRRVSIVGPSATGDAPRAFGVVRTISRSDNKESSIAQEEHAHDHHKPVAGVSVHPLHRPGVVLRGHTASSTVPQRCSHHLHYISIRVDNGQCCDTRPLQLTAAELITLDFCRQWAWLNS